MNPGSTLLVRQFRAHTIGEALVLLWDLKGKEGIVLFHDTELAISTGSNYPWKTDLVTYFISNRKYYKKCIQHIQLTACIFCTRFWYQHINAFVLRQRVYYIWWMALKYHFYPSCKNRGHNSWQVQPPDANSAIGFRARTRKTQIILLIPSIILLYSYLQCETGYHGIIREKIHV